MLTFVSLTISSGNKEIRYIVMDYERIEQLSRKLSNARVDIRLRTASNLLFKLESGIFDKDAITHSTSMTTLMDGVHSSLAFVLENSEDLSDNAKEAHQLLTVLLSIMKSISINPARQISIEPSTRILEQLYQMKNMTGLDGKLSKSIEEVTHFQVPFAKQQEINYTNNFHFMQTIEAMCGLGHTKDTLQVAQTHMEQRIIELTTSAANGAAIAAFGPSIAGAAHHQQLLQQQQQHSQSGSGGRYHGAGAILNSRLVHTGWKFPHFVVTERDERWLFDVEVSGGRECCYVNGLVILLPAEISCSFFTSASKRVRVYKLLN